jgi:Tol biopolymer transport system component
MRSKVGRLAGRVAPIAGASAIAVLALAPSEAAPALRQQGELKSDIFVIDVNGKSLRQVTNGADDARYESPVWSRNGRALAFSGTTCGDCAAALSVADAKSGRIRPVRAAVISAARPSFAPNDRRLVFVGGDANAVYVVNTNGTGLKRLTHDRAAHDQAVWSPDGRHIAYTRQQPNGQWDLSVMNANGTHARALTHTKVSEEQPAWSPDGRRIAFVRQRGGLWSIYVLQLGRSGARRITRGAVDEENPSWSPDGSRLAFVRIDGRRSEIYLARADGRGAKLLQTGLAFSFNPAWAPDGKTIAFAARD